MRVGGVEVSFSLALSEALTYMEGDWDDERDPFGTPHLYQQLSPLQPVSTTAAL